VIAHLLLAFQSLSATQAPVNPFEFFEPSITVTAGDRQTLDAGEPLARAIPSREREVAVVAAVRVAIDGDRLVAWMRRIEALKKSSYVIAIHRFSDPPRIEDLADLTLDPRELSDIAACRPGRCGVKLSAEEMADLQQVASRAGAERHAAIAVRFRTIVLQRVQAFLAGHEIGPFVDHSAPVWPARRLAAIVEESSFLGAHLPEFTAGLQRAHAAPQAGVETFLYWSKEQIADRPIVSVTDVQILRSGVAGAPDVLVAGREIFSTHYVNASLGITALVSGGAGQPTYLVYINRSELDMLHGMFAGLIRWVVQRRLRDEAGRVLLGLRQRLESGEPPE